MFLKLSFTFSVKCIFLNYLESFYFYVALGTLNLVSLIKSLSYSPRRRAFYSTSFKYHHELNFHMVNHGSFNLPI